MGKPRFQCSRGSNLDTKQWIEHPYIFNVKSRGHQKQINLYLTKVLNTTMVTSITSLDNNFYRHS